jgi:hypothetical protein
MRCSLGSAGTVAIVLGCFLSLRATAGLFGPSNYWECILEHGRGVKNDFAAYAVIRKCRKDFPDSPDPERKPSFFGPKTVDDCIVEYGKDVIGEVGEDLINRACKQRYPS